ncbi:MAG: flavodoxin family protein [Pirellulales bacterium]
MPTATPLVICASVHHGNTARVARCIADVLHADVCAPDAVTLASLAEHGIVGFGSGVYYGRMHESLFALLGQLPDSPEPTRVAFVFSTSGLPFLAQVWHAALKRLLTRKGFEVVGAFACRGFDTWGPLWLTGGLNRRHPDGQDLERARAFAEHITAAAGPAGR